MKNRLFKSLTAIFLLICMAFSLFGCDSPLLQKCEHEWVITESTKATCQNEGLVAIECSICGEKSKIILPKGDHVKGDGIDYDEMHHWFNCSECGSDLEFDFHNTTDYYGYNQDYHLGVCDICGEYFLDIHKWDELKTCTACGFSKTEPKPTKEKIEIWVPENKGVKEFTRNQIAAFLKANPDYGYTIDDFVIEAVPESVAASDVLRDVASAPDIYCIYQDQLARLVQADALAPLGQGAAAEITANNDAGSVAAVTVGGKLYAYPMTSDFGCYLYYDKSIVTDPTSLEKIIEDCVNAGYKFHYELENGWYAASFFFGVGCESAWKTDVNGKFISVQDTFDDETLGFIAMKGIQKVTQSSCYISSSAFWGDNVGAIVTGTWNAEDADEYFGENLGVCKLPSFTVDGTTYQLGSFSGFKLMGVKPQTDTEKGAFCAALAKYLTGEQCQLERFNEYQWGPSNKNLQATDAVKNNPSLTALAAQNEHSVPQGCTPNEWWIIAANLARKSAICVDDAEIILALQAYRAEIESIISWYN